MYVPVVRALPAYAVTPAPRPAFQAGPWTNGYLPTLILQLSQAIDSDTCKILTAASLQPHGQPVPAWCGPKP